MTPESVLFTLLAFIVVLLLALLAVIWRLTNSKGTVSWSVTTTIPDDPWSLKFTNADRDEAMRRFARDHMATDEPGPVMPKSMGDPD